MSNQYRTQSNQMLFRLIPIAVFAALFMLYVGTLAQSPVLGDPSEYTFVAHILGIAHPPGYAFMVLLGKLFQTIIPFGSIAWRMHLLSAVAGTTTAVFIYAIIQAWQPLTNLPRWQHVAVGLLTAFTVGTAVNQWQHSIHANPHIITGTFLLANLSLLTKWSIHNLRRGAPLGRLSSSGRLYLYLFCVSAGLGVTHHPLTVFAFPGYALFILWVQPQTLRQPLTLLKMVGFALLGLALWLYFPFASPLQSATGLVNMNTLNGFLDHILGRGISNDLGYYGLPDLTARLLVFWSLLRLQFSWLTIILIIIAVASPIIVSVTVSRAKAQNHKDESTNQPINQSALTLLYLLALLGPLVFTISLRRQDIMAYLLGPMAALGLLAGLGLLALLTWAQQLKRHGKSFSNNSFIILPLFFLLALLPTLLRTAPHISLRSYDEGERHITAVSNQFASTNQNAVLLSDWERMTPLWYENYVNNNWPDPADVRPELVPAAQAPWLNGVFEFLPGGPVYLTNYRREVVDAGFRLRPTGAFYEVVEPGNTTLPTELISLDLAAEEMRVVGYSLPSVVSAGDFIPFTLALTAPITPTSFYAPVLQVGDITFEFTTDSHLLTPSYLPNEVIVERFNFALPLDLPAGAYPITLTLKNLTTNQLTPNSQSLGVFNVAAQANPPRTDHLLANFRQRVGLVSATARGNNGRFSAPWPTPLTAQPGDIVPLTLEWQSLAKAEESYTIFVHLIDYGNTLYAGIDYTPMGGATPTHLWIPKWLPGQRLLDPYRLQIPDNLPPGTYKIEVGLYEMISNRRLHISDAQGNLVGDRYILGEVVVENRVVPD